MTGLSARHVLIDGVITCITILKTVHVSCGNGFDADVTVGKNPQKLPFGAVDYDFAA